MSYDQSLIWFSTHKIHDVENPRRKIRSFRREENQGWVRKIRHVTYMVFDTSKTTYFTSWVFNVMYFTCRKPYQTLTI